MIRLEKTRQEFLTQEFDEGWIVAIVECPLGYFAFVGLAFCGFLATEE